jgi:hypothetical protein
MHHPEANPEEHLMKALSDPLLPCQLAIEHGVTADMPDGQALPPLIENGVPWRVVRRADGCTLWRRLFLTPSLVTDWRTAPGDQTRAP